MFPHFSFVLEREFVWFLSIRWVVHSRSSEILGFLFPIVEKHTSVITICGYGFTNSWINNVRRPPSPPPGEFSSRSTLSRTLFPQRPPSPTVTHLSHVRVLVQQSQRPTDPKPVAPLGEGIFCWISRWLYIPRCANSRVRLLAPASFA